MDAACWLSCTCTACRGRVWQGSKRASSSWLGAPPMRKRLLLVSPAATWMKECKVNSRLLQPYHYAITLGANFWSLLQEWPKPGWLSRSFGSILWDFFEKTAKHRVHWIFFSLDPQRLLNLIFGIGQVRWVLTILANFRILADFSQCCADFSRGNARILWADSHWNIDIQKTSCAMTTTYPEQLPIKSIQQHKLNSGCGHSETISLMPNNCMCCYLRGILRACSSLNNALNSEEWAPEPWTLAPHESILWVSSENKRHMNYSSSVLKNGGFYEIV